MSPLPGVTTGYASLPYIPPNEHTSSARIYSLTTPTTGYVFAYTATNLSDDGLGYVHGWADANVGDSLFIGVSTGFTADDYNPSDGEEAYYAGGIAVARRLYPVAASIISSNTYLWNHGGVGTVNGVPGGSHHKFGEAFSHIVAFAGDTSIAPQYGDFNSDGFLDSEDIDAFNVESRDSSGSVFGTYSSSLDRPSNPFYDLVLDTLVDNTDRNYLIRDLLATEYGDANLDGRVDLIDLGILGDNLNSSGNWADGDFNGDGAVNIVDFGILSDNYGFGEPSSLAAPEPTGVVLVAMIMCVISPTKRL